MTELHEEISDLLSDEGEDRFSCPKEIRKKAMDFLARREYGQRELVKKLADKGYLRRLVEQAVQTLTDEHLQSDDRFAQSFVQSRINQGKGPVRIRLDLSQRGIDDAVIEMAWPKTFGVENSAMLRRKTSKPRPSRCDFFNTGALSRITCNRHSPANNA
jgi:SOS response regulatory protein OraA/RecX